MITSSLDPSKTNGSDNIFIIKEFNMPKVIKLTESDLVNLIKRVLTEETNEASNPVQQAAIAINMKKKGKKPKVIAVSEEQFERLFEYNTEDPILMYEDEFGSVEDTDYESNYLNEAEYQGRKVQLGKIMQGDVKKFKVYVKNDKGKVVKVNFGFGGKSAKGKRMVIKKNNPERRKNLERDIIAIILVQDGNHVIGLVVLGKLLINEIYYHRTSVEFFERTMV
jgi:hypothetical protein